MISLAVGTKLTLQLVLESIRCCAQNVSLCPPPPNKLMRRAAEDFQDFAAPY
jgi:hypothetical protein